MSGAAVFTCAVLVARLVYIALFCPYRLAEDEANYWVWSTHLDWSYYTKGPGIAWAIRAATELLGTSEASIRVVAVLANVVTTMCVAVMAGLVGAEFSRRRGQISSVTTSEEPGFTCDGRAALFGAAAVQLSPIFQGTAVFSTIDGPYCACWAVACLNAMLALMRGRRWGWAACGAAIGLGFLFKYTILLLVPGLVVFAWRARRRAAARHIPQRAAIPLAFGAVLMLAGFAPVVIWNSNNDWATIAHLLGHLGVQGGDMPGAPGGSGERWRPIKWTSEFIVSQFGMVGPLLVLGVAAAVARLKRSEPRGASTRSWESHDPERVQDPSLARLGSDRPLRALVCDAPFGTLFLVCCAAPILLFYLVVSLIAEPEGNWAMGGYVTLLALAGCGASVGMRAFGEQVRAWRAMAAPRPKLGVTRRKPETFVQVVWHTSVIYGVIAGAVMLRLDWMMAATKPIVEAVGPALGVKPEKLFSGRARNLLEADRMGLNAYGFAYVRLKQPTGLEPFYVAQHYGTAAVLTYYLPQQPLVLCSSSRMGGRPTPWDFWDEASLDRPELVGRPALLLGARKEQWEPMFERVEAVDTPNGRLEGENKQGRNAYLGFGYRGWVGRTP
ncbi:MAG: ArnT family glycosyltransferase [Phycisphaerales bacterium]